MVSDRRLSIKTYPIHMAKKPERILKNGQQIRFAFLSEYFQNLIY